MSRTPVQAPTIHEWESALANAGRLHSDDVDGESLTSIQIQKMMGGSLATVRRWLQKMIAADKMICIPRGGTITTMVGVVMPCPTYKLKENPKNEQKIDKCGNRKGKSIASINRGKKRGDIQTRTGTYRISKRGKERVGPGHGRKRVRAAEVDR